jgi:transposase
MEEKRFYAGLDMGTKWIYGTIITGDRELHIVKEAKFPCNAEALEKFLGWIPKNNLSAVIEACGIWMDIYDHLQTMCSEVKVASPLQTKWIGNSRKKTDKIDSLKLATLLKGGLIIESYVPDKDTRLFRRKISHRQGFVAMKTVTKNQIHAVLRQDNIAKPEAVRKDIFTQKGVKWLKTLGRDEIDNYLALIPALDKAIGNATASVAINKFQREIDLLKTMPGIGDLTAATIMSDIGDIKRFKNPKALCSHSGLVPSVYQSGDIDRKGRITKEGSAVLRGALGEAAWAAVRQDCRFRRFFLRLVENGKSTQTAITAVRRKMLYIMWFMLTKNQQYVD